MTGEYGGTRINRYLHKEKNALAFENAIKMYNMSYAQAYILLRILDSFHEKKTLYLVKNLNDAYNSQWASRVKNREYGVADSTRLRVWKIAENDAIDYWGWK